MKNNEFTRKETPCPLSSTEFCDREDKDCDTRVREKPQNKVKNKSKAVFALCNGQ